MLLFLVWFVGVWCYNILIGEVGRLCSGLGWDDVYWRKYEF